MLGGLIVYNEKQKRDFLEQYSRSKSGLAAYERAFNAIQKYEEEWGADMCTKKREDLEPVVNDVLGMRIQGKNARLALYKAYTEWCIEHRISGACDGMLHVDVNDAGKLRDHMVNSPMHLQRYLDVICHKESERTIDDIYRCYLWLAFAGLSEAGIFEINTDDVRFSDFSVRFKERDYPIYRESLQAFKNCVELGSFVYIHPNYSKEIMRPRVPGKQLLRGIKTLAYPQIIRAELSKRTRKAVFEGRTKTRLSYYRAWLSGVFYRMYQLELAGVDPDFSNVASDFISGKTYNLSSGRNLIGAKQRRVAKEYKIDYDRWKKAFFS